MTRTIATEEPTHATAPGDRAVEVVQRARALRPLLEANATEAERLRRLPDENIEALRSAGLFLLCTSTRFGGYQLPVQVRATVYETLGAGCGATGWVTAICNENSWLLSLFAEEAQREYFGERSDPIVACSFMPQPGARRVPGGLMVSGRFPFASGCWHADWCGITVLNVCNDGTPVEGLGMVLNAFVPRSQFVVEETWDTVGMTGTGTHTVVIDDEVFVPEHRLQPWTFLLEPFNAPGPTRYPDETVYKTSGLTNGLMMVAPVLGQARAALDYVVERSRHRGVTYSPYQRQVDSVTFQLQVGDAAMKIQTGELHLRKALQDLHEFGLRGQRPDFTTSSRIQAQLGYIAGQLRDAVEILMSAHGSASFARSCPLQRIWRDVNTAGRHGFYNTGLCRESYGKSVLGLPTVGPLPEMP